MDVMRAQRVEDVVKLESTLAEIEALDREVHGPNARLLPQQRKWKPQTVIKSLQ